ncbi:hypothetical protein C1645_841134 [Glomus cerebriforme]|uniref:Reverse transcriptase zinc-binding domain-containing protein n=1 Tax=Glomus cerebriforme TaxID=658196 RepID=A0A397RYD4_9GLOM|nr:hypothetical protein C1645_841134 [Glomus cerebriforme]
MTFAILNNNNVKSTETDFTSTKKKSFKIKLLLEEISTVEQVKKSVYGLYKNMLCPLCNQEKETFNHVWTCLDIYYIMEGIITDIKDKLERLLIEKGHINKKQSIQYSMKLTLR